MSAMNCKQRAMSRVSDAIEKLLSDCILCLIMQVCIRPMHRNGNLISVANQQLLSSTGLRP